MKKDLNDCTFIIPLKIESDDRLRNSITVCCFLLSNFDTNIIIKEVNESPVFKDYALPQISEFLDGEIQNINYIFEKQETDFFHKTKYFNEMILKSKTKVISAYDIDVMLPISSYLQSKKMILDEGYDLIYPYGWGDYQRKIFTDDGLVSEFLSNDCDFSFLDKNSKVDDAKWGHVQFFKRSSYVEGGMENENFKSWGPEDEEKYYRFPKLGYTIGRIDDIIYHLEHSRGNDSYYSNPYHLQNTNMLNDIKSLDAESLREYYNRQNYLQKYQKEVSSNEQC